MRPINRKLPIADLPKLVEYFYYTKEHPVQLLPNRRWSLSEKTTRYRNKIENKFGIVGGYNVNADSEIVDVTIDISGKYLETLGVVDTWRLIVGLHHRFGFHFSRIDIRIDDPSYSLIPSQDMFDAHQKGNVFYIENIEHLVDEEGNETILFGSRKSPKCTKTYNHANKTQRYETEFKKELAKRIGEALATLDRKWVSSLGEKYSNVNHDDNEVKSYDDEIDKWLKTININTQVIERETFIKLAVICKDNFDLFLQKILACLALSTMDFRDKSNRKDKSKASCKETVRLDFWQKFIDDALAIDTLETQATNLLQKWVNQSTDTITLNLNNAIGDIQNGLASSDENVS